MAQGPEEHGSVFGRRPARILERTRRDRMSREIVEQPEPLRTLHNLVEECQRSTFGEGTHDPRDQAGHDVEKEEFGRRQDRGSHIETLLLRPEEVFTTLSLDLSLIHI